MWLHLTSSLPPKALPADPSLSSSSPPLRTTLRSLNPKPCNSLVRCSSTLPKSAIQRIAEKLHSLGFAEENQTPDPEPALGSAGEIFVPLPTQLPHQRVGHTIDTSWSTPENPNERRKKAPSLAELTLPQEELRRLRRIGIGLKRKLKIGKAGVTEGVVNGIHERWTRSEVVKIFCEEFVKMNMKRTHDILERKTGGLVVWRSGSKIILYRGANYKNPYFLSDQLSTSGSVHNTSLDSDMDEGEDSDMDNCTSGENGVEPDAESPTRKMVRPQLVQGVGLQHRVRFQLPGEAQLTEEADRLLDGLGPRFTDWWGYNPLPVDGDLLPAVIPGYRRPFRLLPYGVQPKLTNDEMTTLRRLGRPLPYHFVLGRNRKLQGLAASIVKLWEKCEIAKIAVKRGVENTNSLMMVEELQRLTGGTMLSRDEESIVLYRGKDFLPPAVSSAIEERRRFGVHGEKQKATNTTALAAAEEHKLATAEHDSDDILDKDNDQKMVPLSKQRKIKASESALQKTSIKLSVLLENKAKAEKLLEELEKAEIAQKPAIDKEGITEEERYMLRKVGLRMRPFLLMGRRGVFDGTIENMHLHWKYRELVKILCNEKSIEAVHQVAQTLEVESGGILVAVDRVSKGYVIIVYRGKNYVRPASLRPKTLLNKKAAMKRSIEAQRRHSLKLHVLKLNSNIDDLKLQLNKGKEARSILSIDESASPLVVEKNAVVSTSMSLDEGLDDLAGSPQATREDKLIGHSLQNGGNETGEMELESLSEYATDENHASELANIDGKSGTCDTASYSDDHMLERTGCSSDAEQCVSAGKAMRSSDESADARNVDSADARNVDSGNRVMWPSVELLSSSAAAWSGGYGNKAMRLSVESVSSSAEARSGGYANKPVSYSADARSSGSDHNAMRSSFGPLSSSAGAGSGAYGNKAMRLSVEPASSSADDRSGDLDIVAENKTNEPHSRAIQLSNRERLLLRKQALKTRKRPVIAVGRSNVMTGVAKTIKEHFKRHPLAIVSIKGRAKGTCVQEVVFQLEEATGAVLVSQEPSKVILYRGWGAEDEPPRTSKGNIIRVSEEGGVPPPPVSPELMAAIKFECGLL